MAGARKIAPHNVHLSPNTADALRARAWDLRVSFSMLCRDVLEAWLAQTTDFKDPMFSRKGAPIAEVYMPPERYPGYRKDLGFEE